MSEIKLYNGDCLDVMDRLIAEGVKVDAIITDPPYGVTGCKWDSIIPLDKMWVCLNALLKSNGVCCLFSTQPFTSVLIGSNIEKYRYSWVWNKKHGSNFQLAKLQPLRITEDICVFSNAKSANGAKETAIYYPIKVLRDEPVRNGGGLNTCKLLNKNSMKKQYNVYYDKHPTNILEFDRENQINKLHPTQKPVDLMKYLIKTYTLEGETVLDFTMGSGTTGVACKLLNRSFIGIELDKTYFKVAEERINNAVVMKGLF